MTSRRQLAKTGWFRFPYSAVQRVLDAAQSLTWVRRLVGANRPNGEGSLSRFFPTGDLQRAFEAKGRVWMPTTPPDRDELIVLGQHRKDKNRSTVMRDASPEVARWQDDLYRVNLLFANRCIYLDLPDATLQPGLHSPQSTLNAGDGAPQGAEIPINFSHTSLKRMFTRGRLDRGGRFYGGWWQQVPSSWRRHIVIGDQMTVECDYSGMALRCLYAQEGISIGTDDPYDIGLCYAGPRDGRRAIVKEYVNAILNDEKGTYRLDSQKLRQLGLSLKELKLRVATKHTKISHHFHKGTGLQLQFVDSEIAMGVMLRFTDMGEVCLPVHDSFIVRGGLSDLLQSVMQEEFQRQTGVPGMLTADTVITGDRMGLPEVPVNRLRSSEGIVQPLINHFNRFSITQEFHACYWEHATTLIGDRGIEG